MKSIKCPVCGLVAFETQTSCKRCGIDFTADNSKNNYGNGSKIQNFAYSAYQSSGAVNETEEVRSAARKKIKWGLMISTIGFAVTSAAIYLGVFQGYENTEKAYIKLVKLFSLITILPLAAVLAGTIEYVSGISIFKIIEKWEEMPQWLGWISGIGAFLLVLFLILFVAAVVIFNFF